MKLLLDTHAVLWWLAGDPRLSAPAQAAITDRANSLLVSVVSAYEIGTKVRIGKMSSSVAREFPLFLATAGISALGLNLSHMTEGAGLAWNHRDPWDRLIAAQATLEGCSLVSADRAFAALPVEVVW